MRIVLVLLLCQLLAGCTTAALIKEDYSTINYADGINQEEAVILAQNYCIGDSRCSKESIVSSAELSEETLVLYGEKWKITFKSKFGAWFWPSLKYLLVDKKTGEVSNFGTIR